MPTLYTCSRGDRSTACDQDARVRAQPVSINKKRVPGALQESITNQCRGSRFGVPCCTQGILLLLYITLT